MIFKKFVVILVSVLSSASGYGSDGAERFLYESAFNQTLGRVNSEVLPEWRSAHTDARTRWGQNIRIDEQVQPTCFISFSYPPPPVLRPLYDALKAAGIRPLCSAFGDNSPGTSVADFARRTMETNYVIFVGTPNAKQKYDNKTGVVTQEMGMIFQRSLTLYNSIFIILVEGDQHTALPGDFADKSWISYHNANNYFTGVNQNVEDYRSFCVNTLDLIKHIYTRNIFSPRGAQTDELLHSVVSRRFEALHSFERIVQVLTLSQTFQTRFTEMRQEEENRRTREEEDINAGFLENLSRQQTQSTPSVVLPYSTTTGLVETPLQIRSTPPQPRDVFPTFTPPLTITTAQRLTQPIDIPPIAQGYEGIYQRFLRGVLIYRSTQGTDVRLPISQLGNPLEGTFDLSRCEGIGQYLSISTGYKKRLNVNNQGKFEIWFAPRFLVERENNHFRDVMADWSVNKPIGIFWTWGNEDASGLHDYYADTFEDVGTANLYEKWNWQKRCNQSLWTMVWSPRERYRNLIAFHNPSHSRLHIRFSFGEESPSGPVAWGWGDSLEPSQATTDYHSQKGLQLARKLPTSYQGVTGPKQ